MKRQRILQFVLILFIVLCLTACHIPFNNSAERDSSETTEQGTESTHDEQPENPPPPPPPTRVILAATGDIMMHSTQINAGRKSDGTYDFRYFFSDIKPYLRAADLVYGNLETTLAGREPYTGYPMFNAPDAIADALKDAGFHIVQTANNHILDSRSEGAIRTHNVLQEKGIHPVGTAVSQEERKPLIVEKNDIKIAFLAYTYGTNGIPIPEDQPYLVNLIDEDVIRADIEEAEASGAEFIIVGLHFGNEYEREPTEEQRQLVTRIFEMGADVILGGHPHVLQPMERMEVNGEDKFVVYSLGNLVSNQFFNPYVNKGLILYLDIEKDYELETVTLKDVRYLPTVVHRYEQHGTGYAIVPIEAEHMDNGQLVYDYPGLSFKQIEEAWEQTTSHMEKYEKFPVFKLDDNEAIPTN